MKLNFIPSAGRLLVLFFLSFILFIRKSLAQVCSDPANVIYGLTSAGNIRPVHVGTGAVDSALNPPYLPGYVPTSNAIGYDPVNGSFYYFEQEYYWPGLFVSYNPSTNVTTTLAQMPDYIEVLSAGVNAAGTGYYCLDAGYALFYYDIAANSWTQISTDLVDQNGVDQTAFFRNMYGGDMAFDGTGNLWMVIANDTSYALYMASGPLPTTSVPQFQVMQIIPQTTLYEDGGSIDGIAFDPSGNIYLSTNSDLYFLQNGTTTITHIGSFNLDTASEVMEDLTSCNFPSNTILRFAWINFTALLQPNQAVMLNWQYAQPAGGGYSIERSPDGQHWSAIGYQAAGKAGFAASYSWLDANPLSGKNYYRIVLINPDSTASYSPIRVIEVTEGVAITVSPNPTTDAINIQYDGSGGTGKEAVYDPSGRMIQQNVLFAGSNIVSLAGLSKGLYLVSVQLGDGRSVVQKVLKE